jgi:transcription-repair coupling factor (superfamily II helicase)
MLILRRIFNIIFTFCFQFAHFASWGLYLICMNNNGLAAIRQRYIKSELISNLGKHILANSQSTRAHIVGSCGSEAAFILFGLQQWVKKSILIVCTDKDNAVHYHNDLETVFESKEALLLLDSYRNPYQFSKLNRNAVLQRTEIINKIINFGHRPQIIVSYPEALLEKVIAPAELKNSAISIKTGEKLDINFLAEVLQEYGFIRVDFVSEAGEYAIRGSIVDIYSYGNEQPYRIDLLDDEVESLRIFNPETQLSEKKISSLTIIPNINTNFKDSQKIDFLSLLPKNCLVVLNNSKFICDKLSEGKELSENLKLNIANNPIEDKEALNLILAQSFISADGFKSALDKFSMIEWGNYSPLQPLNYPIIKLQSQAQPAFNKNFELLIRHLHQNTADNCHNYIFADNSKQLERFSHIFQDLQAKVAYEGINCSLAEGFSNTAVGVVCYTDHQIFERYHAYRLRKGFDKNNSLQLKTLQELQMGDYVTHIDYGIGRYVGLEKIVINGVSQEAVKLTYKDGDLLHVSIQSLHKISKYAGKDLDSPPIHKLGSGVWAKTKQKAKTKIKELAFDLIKLYAKRKATKGFAFPEDTYLQNELEASFIYEDTPDQAKATEAVKADMEKSIPMDRLICGDVGFGKTEIAIRAAFKAAVSGKQVAILVPTTILALQHAQTFTDRLKPFGVVIDYINRFRTAKEKTTIYKNIASGHVNILIGTHAILNEKINFKSLGLLIIDEEQKFGVGAKEKLRNFKTNVDTLTLTATPIPRTLQFSLMAARDLSVINTPPPNRKPIETALKTFDNDMLKTAIENEVNRGGQVFFVHNRVQSLPEMVAVIKSLVPNVDVAMAHGQMEVHQLEETLLAFIKGFYDVLVCTNIIETGLDIPNANTIIINNAHHFGLSDLHQLRGRVGRSNKKAYCFLLAPPYSVLSSESKKRLQTIEQFAELGAGFQIAMKDLDIRGAGDILGGEQSGFISNIGYETYQKILEEAVNELKQNEYKELFADEAQNQPSTQEVTVDCDEEMMFPDSYVESIHERLGLYQGLNKLKNEDDIKLYRTTLVDKFGKIPLAVENMFIALKLRWLGQNLGLEKIILQRKKLRCYFIANPQDRFYESRKFNKLMQYIQIARNPSFIAKQTANILYLVCENVNNLSAVFNILLLMDKQTNL